MRASARDIFFFRVYTRRFPVVSVSCHGRIDVFKRIEIDDRIIGSESQDGTESSNDR